MILIGPVAVGERVNGSVLTATRIPSVRKGEAERRVSPIQDINRYYLRAVGGGNNISVRPWED